MSYLDERRAMKLFGRVPAKKKSKAIPKVSEKRKTEMKSYKKLVAEFLEEHKRCQIKSPVCTKKATTVNHTRRRGANLMNVKDWEASCWACNGWIESHDKEAREAGHLKSVHKKEK